MSRFRTSLFTRCAAVSLILGAGHSLLAFTVAAQAAGEVRGAGDAGPLKRGGKPGYDYQDQYIGIPGKRLADNMEPVVAHLDQAAEAQRKLAALEKRTGKKPNIIVFILDDVG